ncbi:glycosyltransferase family 2 protein [Lentisalinibacter sediminis]|uniref:glycosyltransferase family 2 protein n=1 Tax=Lentisalinibacter sediminis TaxID=2992237 RepID=UPI003863B5E3
MSSLHQRNFGTRDNDGPLVSAIIPTYNRASMLRTAVESVFSQTYSPIELIIVDDASTEDISTYIRPWLDRLTIVRRPSNGGRAAAINVGIKHASGEFIAVLDSDDAWTPTKTELQMQVFAEHPETAAVCGGVQSMDEHDERLPYITTPKPTIQYERLAVSMCLPGSNSNEIVRRAVLEDLGGYDENLKRAQDYDLWLRVAKSSAIRGVSEVTCLKRAHDEIRKDGDIDTIIDCRRQIAAKISDSELRSKHIAWMWYQMAWRAYDQRRRFRAFCCLLRSWVVRPSQIDSLHPRLKGIVWELQARRKR